VIRSPTISASSTLPIFGFSRRRGIIRYTVGFSLPSGLRTAFPHVTCCRRRRPASRKSASDSLLGPWGAVRFSFFAPASSAASGCGSAQTGMFGLTASDTFAKSASLAFAPACTAVLGCSALGEASASTPSGPDAFAKSASLAFAAASSSADSPAPICCRSVPQL
jgi:hypothetical protein